MLSFTTKNVESEISFSWIKVCSEIGREYVVSASYDDILKIMNNQESDKIDEGSLILRDGEVMVEYNSEHPTMIIPTYSKSAKIYIAISL